MGPRNELKVMSFGEHLEELRFRVIRSLLVALGCTIVALLFQDLLMEAVTVPHRDAMAQVEGRQGYQKVLETLTRASDALGDLSPAIARSALDKSKQEVAWLERWRQMKEKVEGQGETSPLGDLASLVEERLGLLEKEVVERSSAGDYSQRLEVLRERLTVAAITPPWGGAAIIEASVARVEAIAQGVRSWQEKPKPTVVGPGVVATQPVAEEVIEDGLQRLLAIAIDLDQAAAGLLELKEWRQRARPLQLLSYTESFFSHLKLCFLAGVLVGLPWISFEIWGFISAGLYRRERQAVFLYLPASFFCLAAGLSFAYLILVPVGLTYLGSYGTGEMLLPGFTLREYMGLVFTLLLGMGLVFQLPLVMVFLARSGIATPKQFRSVQKYALLGALVLGAMLTPPDVVTQMLMAGPLVILYEVGILASRVVLSRVGTVKPKPEDGK